MKSIGKAKNTIGKAKKNHRKTIGKAIGPFIGVLISI